MLIADGRATSFLWSNDIFIWGIRSVGTILQDWACSDGSSVTRCIAVIYEFS